MNSLINQNPHMPAFPISVSGYFASNPIDNPLNLALKTPVFPIRNPTTSNLKSFLKEKQNISYLHKNDLRYLYAESLKCKAELLNPKQEYAEYKKQHQSRNELESFQQYLKLQAKAFYDEKTDFGKNGLDPQTNLAMSESQIELFVQDLTEKCERELSEQYRALQEAFFNPPKPLEEQKLDFPAIHSKPIATESQKSDFQPEETTNNSFFTRILSTAATTSLIAIMAGIKKMTSTTNTDDSPVKQTRFNQNKPNQQKPRKKRLPRTHHVEAPNPRKTNAAFVAMIGTALLGASIGMYYHNVSNLASDPLQPKPLTPALTPPIEPSPSLLPFEAALKALGSLPSMEDCTKLYNKIEPHKMDKELMPQHAAVITACPRKLPNVGYGRFITDSKISNSINRFRHYYSDDEQACSIAHRLFPLPIKENIYDNTTPEFNHKLWACLMRSRLLGNAHQGNQILRDAIHNTTVKPWNCKNTSSAQAISESIKYCSHQFGI